MSKKTWRTRIKSFLTFVEKSLTLNFYSLSFEDQLTCINYVLLTRLPMPPVESSYRQAIRLLSQDGQYVNDILEYCRENPLYVPKEWDEILKKMDLKYS